MSNKIVTNDEIAVSYPLHWLIWNNSLEELEAELSKARRLIDIEQLDPRGRTPLHLAVSLGHTECAEVLFRKGANSNAVNKDNWTVLQESVSTANPELVRLALKYRDNQRTSSWFVGIPELLNKINEMPDFYVEMTWEFTSWVPLVSRMCPSDTYKVYKSGSCVRIDTTLIGFDNTNWERGNRSYIFKGEGNNAVVMEVDHDKKEVYTERLSLSMPEELLNVEPSEESIVARLTSPIATTNIDTDKIAFERNKSGIWGWRSDKSETVDGYECKVFSAVNVELVTKKRTEHLSNKEKEECNKYTKSPMESLIGAVVDRGTTQKPAKSNDEAFNPSAIMANEYFNENLSLDSRDIGRPREETIKVQKFKATLSLCEDYPLSLQEQVLPIIDLMARSNAHFQKLKDFITLQLPAGFPIKIEIPLYHILNARVTFGNIFASNTQVDGVHFLRDDSNMSCTIDAECFSVSPDVQQIGNIGYHDRHRVEDDELMNFAVQQSLMDVGSENDQVTFMEALDKGQPRLSYSYNADEVMLQRAIAESMLMAGSSHDEGETNPEHTDSEIDSELLLAIQLSKNDHEATKKRKEEEDAELDKILQLSLIEK